MSNTPLNLLSRLNLTGYNIGMGAIKTSDEQFLGLLEDRLRIPRLTKKSPFAVDLFAGCGGLALGLEASGIRTRGYEIDPSSCATYERNLNGACVRSKLEPGFDYQLDEEAQIIVGGPPCQPFSVNGHQAGPRDSRDGFPAFLDAVEQLNPRVVIFENVRGMLYRNRSYLDQIIRELESLRFIVEEPKVLRAVDYGVPQKRERLFVVAHRSSWTWPKQRRANAITAGEALGSMATECPEDSKFLTPSMDAYVHRYEVKSKCVRPRDLHLDEPARTLTCRNLNGATGDMMRVRLPDGRRRRIRVREAARLQTFPDSFAFMGPEGSQFNQIGNAVPPMLARAIGSSIRECLRHNDVTDEAIRGRQESKRPLVLFDEAGDEG